ncbi:MAG: hypothetical protein IJP61_00505 [Treponema sp.]|nr:hypothetical protein [Treponema sp.]
MRRVFQTIFLVFSVFCLMISCSKNNDESLYQSAMVSVDMHLRDGDLKEAFTALKKSERYASTSLERIGIYRRYMRLGEKKAAEKILVRGLKKNPGNLEISAIYGHFLIVEGRLDDAVKISSSLIGTKYGSVYSEAALKKIEKSVKESGRRAGYLSKSLSGAYYDAYVATKNPQWLKNASLAYLASGEYSKAAALQPPSFDPKDALFWSFVQYDAGNFDLAITNLAFVETPTVLSTSLASDSYVMLNDLDHAEHERELILENTVDFPANISVNSAIWAYNNEQYKKAYSLLMGVIMSGNVSVPALLTYGKLAVEDSKPVPMSDLELTLRKTSLRTNKMREFDERPRFLVSDAIFRINEAIEKGDKSEELIVERLSLKLFEKKDAPVKQKMALLWEELEHNTLGTNLYPPKLVQFVVQKLISYNEVESARELFSNYIKSKYLLPLSFEKNSEYEIPAVQTDVFGGERRISVQKITPAMKMVFGDEVAKAASGMALWELEYAAYFSLLDGNAKAARQLYEFVLTEGGDFNSVATMTSPSSVINLAMIMSSTGDKAKALSLYGLAAGKAREPELKSKILCRMAKVRVGMKDPQEAVRALDYAIMLDPKNAEARALKRQLDINKEK